MSSPDPEAAPYRSPQGPGAEPPDVELACARTIHRRAEAIRRAVTVPCVLGGLALGVAGYFALREAFFATLGAHQPYVTGTLALLPPFALSFKVAQKVSDAMIRGRVRTWVRDLAREHQLSVEALTEHAEIALGERLPPLVD